LTKYEHPNSNMERFQLIKKWFFSNHFGKEEKCQLMNWLEEFFKMYVQAYLSFGDDAIQYVEDIQW
jgi:hypothetical protein